jgi:predicted dithiol-disulfide oxidoreductase (DUF899 family)
MTTTATMTDQHKVVSQSEWLSARKDLLAKEREFTHLRDDLSRRRREMPWVKVEKNYVFEGHSGKVPLASLFAGTHQLIVYHFMLGPGWAAGCPSCSYLADHFEGPAIHLPHRDTTLAVISRAPYPEIAAFKQRMGWRFPWVSSFGTDFNFDFQVSFKKEDLAAGKIHYNYAPGSFPAEEAPGASVFYKDDTGSIFHTYSTYARGLDIFLGTYNFLDITPKGRDEDNLKHTMAWVRHHDRYDDNYKVDPAMTYEPPIKSDGACH